MGRWDTRKPGAPNRINHFPSDWMDGIRNLTAHDSALTDHNREMAYRPGTHPYRSARDSFGPPIIFIVHINQFFAIVSPTHRWPLYHRKFCSVHGQHRPAPPLFILLIVRLRSTGRSTTIQISPRPVYRQTTRTSPTTAYR